MTSLAHWTDGQKEHFTTVMSALPGWIENRKTCAALSSTGIEVVNLQVGGHLIFFLQREANAANHQLIAIPLGGGEEKIIANPRNDGPPDDTANHRSIDWYNASPDGQFVVYASSSNGSEQATLRVINVETGVVTLVARASAPGGRMTRVRPFGIVWSPDSRSFIYQQHTSAKYQNIVTAVWDVRAENGETSETLDIRQAVDRIRGLQLGPDDTPIVSFSSGGDWLVVGVRPGCSRNCAVFATRIGSRDNGWQQLSHDALAWHADGEKVYLLELGKDGRGQLSQRVITADAPAAVMASGPVIEDFCVGRDTILLRCLDGGRSNIVRVNRKSGETETVTLPYDGHVTECAYDHFTNEFIVGLSSWTRPLLLLRLDSSDDRCTDIDWLPASRLSFENVTSMQVAVCATDGTVIPMTILHKRGLPLDGTAPAVLVAYGFFGISLRASFQPGLIDWVGRGGVWAIAHVRGGGEGGDAWAEAGHGVHHDQTIDDYIKCADHLISAGWTSSDRLAAEGTSAGGLTAGGAMVRYPELFTAVILRVPVTNTLRLEMHENGPPNIAEYGTVETQQGLAALLVSDVCQRIQDGANYPAVLLTMGRHDPRVTPFQAPKLAAHLQHSTSSGRPVVLRIDENSGHGPGSTKNQLDHELADRLTFLDAMLTATTTRRLEIS